MENLEFVLSPPTWMKGDCWIDGEYVELDSGGAKEYEFDCSEASREMAFEFAALPWPDPTDKDHFAGRVKAFVRRYGLLWHGADEKTTGVIRESLSEWHGHALTLGFLGSIYQAINESIKQDMSADPVQAAFRQYGTGLPHVSAGDPEFDRKYVHEATRWLGHALNIGMQGRSGGRYQWGFSAEGPGDLRLAQCPADLQSHAFATFAVLMATKAPLKACPGCGRLFSPRTRADQKWCHPGCGSTKRGQNRRAKPPGQ